MINILNFWDKKFEMCSTALRSIWGLKNLVVVKLNIRLIDLIIQSNK